MTGSKLEGPKGPWEDPRSSPALRSSSAVPWPAVAGGPALQTLIAHTFSLPILGGMLRSGLCLRFPRHPTRRACKGLPPLREPTWTLGRPPPRPLPAREGQDQPQPATPPGHFLEGSGAAHAFPPPLPLSLCVEGGRRPRRLTRVSRARRRRGRWCRRSGRSNSCSAGTSCSRGPTGSGCPTRGRTGHRGCSPPSSGAE